MGFDTIIWSETIPVLKCKSSMVLLKMKECDSQILNKVRTEISYRISAPSITIFIPLSIVAGGMLELGTTSNA